MWQHWLNLLAGIWLIVSPYVGFTSDAMVTNMVVTGIVVAVLAIWGALETNRSTSRMPR
ncbi:MAG TPA: SPW repeat protein [Verrucomicrobiae bacterium]|nr:SPW repeat protein [Verrucomicrobiae bacterium]